MKTFSLVAAFLLILCTISPKATAWLRPHFADATVVERANLIVAGHIERGSIEVVPHAMEHGGRSWHHTARLAITTTLKGSAANSTIPIYIAYGLTPIVGDTWTHPEIGATFGSPNTGRGLPKDRIEIMDTGNSAQGFDPLVDDAGKDNIWFLRKQESELLGIHDPEDVQPLDLKEYLSVYLASDAESQLRSYIWANPSVAKRAQNYLDHLEVIRLTAIGDPIARAQGLLPYALLGQEWNGTPEANHGIVGCGPIAGPLLLSVFLDDSQHFRRFGVIRMWSEMGFKKSIPMLIDLLATDNAFWERERLEAGWWNSDKNPPATSRRREKYSDDYAAVCALRALKDARAIEVLESTLTIWKRINFENKQIVEECEAALRELGSAPTN